LRECRSHPTRVMIAASSFCALSRSGGPRVAAARGRSHDINDLFRLSARDEKTPFVWDASLEEQVL